MQGSLFDEIPELRFATNLLREAKVIAKKRLSKIMPNESKEDYLIDLKDETRLEFAFLLRKLADKIDENTLKRQKDTIEVLYEKVG